tara:strand:+ start:1841 stop:2290 length:450 start_codon:yes stop_codon:yes gene_type:complete
MKGQAQTVFLFILIALIIGLVVLFGYKAVSKATIGAEDIAMTTFINDIEQDVNSVRRLRGSTRVFTYRVPGETSQVCFVTDPGASSRPSIGSFTGTKDNFFLLEGQGLIVQSTALGPIEVAGNELCIPILGKIKVKLTGKGDVTLIEQG